MGLVFLRGDTKCRNRNIAFFTITFTHFGGTYRTLCNAFLIFQMHHFVFFGIIRKMFLFAIHTGIRNKLHSAKMDPGSHRYDTLPLPGGYN